MNRLLSKFDSLAKISLCGIFAAKFFDHVYLHALKIWQQKYLKRLNFFKQSEFRKKSNQAVLAVVIKDNSILLTKRKDVPVWVLPGGGQELHETSQEACIREVQEETGLTVECLRPLLILLPHNRLTHPTTLFLCKNAGGALTVGHECSEAAYFPLDRLPKDFFWPHKKWMEEGLASSQAITRRAKEITWKEFFRYFIKHPMIVMRFLWTRITSR